MEAHATDALNISTIRDIIGLESDYTPLFEHSLRVIPEDQLFDISWDRPLGKGENGAVYGAMWRKPVGHLATLRTGMQEMHIVLKDVLPRIGASRDPFKKLIREVSCHELILESTTDLSSWTLHTQVWVVERLDVSIF